jgi:hypothetical protein
MFDLSSVLKFKIEVRLILVSANMLLRQPINPNPYMPTSQGQHLPNISVASNLSGNSGYSVAGGQVYNEGAPEFVISSSSDLSSIQTQQGSSVTDSHGLQSTSASPSSSHNSFRTPNSGSYGFSPTTEQLEGTDQNYLEDPSMLARSTNSPRRSVSSRTANYLLNQQGYTVQPLQNAYGYPLRNGDLHSYQPLLSRISMNESERRNLRAPQSTSNTSSPSQASHVRETNAASPKKRKHRCDEESDLSYPGTVRAGRKKYGPEQKLTVAETRRNGACMRCRRQRITVCSGSVG